MFGFSESTTTMFIYYKITLQQCNTDSLLHRLVPGTSPLFINAHIDRWNITRRVIARLAARHASPHCTARFRCTQREKRRMRLTTAPSQHAVIGPRADISGWQAAVLGTRLPITARFPAADAALALAGGDLSVLGPREARALISDARRIPMIYYLF